MCVCVCVCYVCVRVLCVCVCVCVWEGGLRVLLQRQEERVPIIYVFGVPGVVSVALPCSMPAVCAPAVWVSAVCTAAALSSPTVDGGVPVYPGCSPQLVDAVEGRGGVDVGCSKALPWLCCWVCCWVCCSGTASGCV